MGRYELKVLAGDVAQRWKETVRRGELVDMTCCRAADGSTGVSGITSPQVCGAHALVQYVWVQVPVPW
jgi:hypothetical protein